MALARIYRPAKNAMQSGRANLKKWVLEFEPKSAKIIDPLMGWTGSTDTDGQVRLRFSDKDAAVRYAEKYGIPFQLIEPHERSPKRKSYADNFKFEQPE